MAAWRTDQQEDQERTRRGQGEVHEEYLAQENITSDAHLCASGLRHSSHGLLLHGLLLLLLHGLLERSLSLDNTAASTSASKHVRSEPVDVIHNGGALLRRAHVVAAKVLRRAPLIRGGGGPGLVVRHACTLRC